MLLHIAPLLLLAGQVSEYRQLCKQTLDTQGSNTSHWGNVIRLCGLDPMSAGNPAQVLRLAQEGIQLNEGDVVGQDAIGRASYRAGDYQKAVEHLLRAAKKASAIGETTKMQIVCLDLALAYHYGGHHQDALDWLRRAAELRGKNAVRFKLGGHFPMQVYVLQREAESLIGKDVSGASRAKASRGH